MKYFFQDPRQAGYALSALQGTRLNDQSTMRIEFAAAVPEVNGYWTFDIWVALKND